MVECANMPFDCYAVKKSVKEAIEVKAKIPTSRLLEHSEITFLENVSGLKNLFGQFLCGELELTYSRGFLSRQYEKSTRGRKIAELGGELVLPLPPLHEKGKLEIYPNELEVNASSNYSTVVRFDDSRLPTFLYKTRFGKTEEIEKVLEKSVILASLPEDILDKVKALGQILVISASSTGDRIGSGQLEDNISLELTWNDSGKTIEAVEIDKKPSQTNYGSVFFLISQANSPFTSKVEVFEGTADVLSADYLKEVIADFSK